MAGKRIAIVGAGPMGIEAAVYARSLGYDVALFDRGAVADNLRSWGFVRMFSPWRMNTSRLGRQVLRRDGHWQAPDDSDCPTGNELRERYLLPLIHAAGLEQSIQAQTRVITIGKDDFPRGDAIGSAARGQSPFRILLSDQNGREQIDNADIVFDCSGTYGNHRWAGRGGIPAPGELALQGRTWYTIPDVRGKDRERFANRHTLLMGCGFSAATTLLAFDALQKDFPDTRLSWAIRRPGQALQAIHGDVLPARRDLVLKALALADSPPPWLQFLGTCVMEAIDPGEQISVSLRSVQTTLALTVNEIVALVGYMPDSAIYEQLQIHQCYATGGPIKMSTALLDESAGDGVTAGSTMTSATLANPEPNFFILGAKSYGTNSNFLLSGGHAQVVDAFRLLKNDPVLNLYE